MSLIQSLPEGPLDIVGDIHGEFDALLALLSHLGYDLQGHHPQGRTLVFVGDFCDRGPDSPAADPQALLGDLRRELLALNAISAEERDTTLLIAPACMEDFLDFNDFTALADDLIEELELDGILQVAFFHPQFQFAGTQADDVSNCTNRTPYPTLHLLREESIDRAVAVFPEADAIFERNIEVLEGLGPQGWADLDVGPRCPMHAQPSVNGQGEHA